jgi:hypothetical protein
MNTKIIKSAVLLALLGSSAMANANEFTDDIDGITINPASDTQKVTHNADDGELIFSIDSRFSALLLLPDNFSAMPIVRYRYKTSDGIVGAGADTFKLYFKLRGTDADGVEVTTDQQVDWLAKTGSDEWNNARANDIVDGYDELELDLSGLITDGHVYTTLEIKDGARRNFLGDIHFDYVRFGD